MLLKLAQEYLQLCRALPGVSVEATQRVNHLLKLFNRQMMALVLGGEAKTNKTLKKITATNIALSAQTCGLLIGLIPPFRAQLEECLEEGFRKSVANMPLALLEGGNFGNDISGAVEATSGDEQGAVRGSTGVSSNAGGNNMPSQRARAALIAEFTGIVTALQDHHSSLLRKLSTILVGRYDAAAKGLFSEPHPPVLHLRAAAYCLRNIIFSAPPASL